LKKYKIPQGVQHKIRVGINQFSLLWAKNWFKIVLVVAVGVFFMQKSLNLNLGLSNKIQSTENQNIKPEKEAPKSTITPNAKVEKTNKTGINSGVSIFDFTYYLISEVSSNHDDNRVNDFSNIGLIINPDFVKKHKIDPKIVAAKQKIVDNYIKRHKGIAKAEEEEFGIPASITLAQGLLESDAGGSRLARNNNNHFGIKCFSKTCTKGHCVNYTDDTHKDFFRNYESAWGSFRGHSLLLQKPRYKSLYQLKKSDYKGWANGLRKAGYATDKRYGEKLIKIIEVLELDDI
jgi:flagellum-specific peptidoglycan hydrolase FlgJ